MGMTRQTPAEWTERVKSQGVSASSQQRPISPVRSALDVDAPLPPGGAAYLTWTPDQQIVGFRSLEKINPVHIVRHAAHIDPLPKANHQIAPRWTWNCELMDLERYIETWRISGVIVLKDGKVALERYGLGREEGDAWLLTSATKSVTSILVGAAIQDGYIEGLDAPVTDYIPELKDSAYEGVTGRHLLTMTSGVRWTEDIQGDFTHPDANFLAYWAPVLETGIDSMVSYLRRLPRADHPGTKYNYSEGDPHLAGIMVSNATGKSLSDYLSEKLWQPYGMEGDAYWQLDSSGREQAGGFLSVTLRDCARVGQFMLDGGKAGAVQVLPPGWIADATSAHVTLPPDPESNWKGYGYFWWVREDCYAALGGFGQRIIVYPKDNVVIAINSAWPKVRLPGARPALEAFAEALRSAATAKQ